RRHRVAAFDHLLARALIAEIAERVAARAGVGRRGQDIALFRVVQRIVKPRQRPHRIAEGGMRRDVRDALAVDIDVAPVAQTLTIFRAGIWPLLVGNPVFWPHVRPGPTYCRRRQYGNPDASSCRDRGAGETSPARPGGPETCRVRAAPSAPPTPPSRFPRSSGSGHRNGWRRNSRRTRPARPPRR